MSKKVYEGQLDFLGLLNEYTDSQGATVRVREPGNSRLKPVDKSASKVKVSEAEPEQLKLDFGAVSKQEPVKVEEVKVEPVKEIVKTEPVKTEEVKPQPPAEEKPASKSEKVKKAKPAPKAAEPVKEEVKAETVKEETKPEPVAEVLKPEPTVPVSSGGGSKEILFKQCKKCWCFDCKHNSRNEGVPRDICGTSMPCPACESCISEDQATICEIGNAKEGCKLRAQEEGILIEEEPV